MKIALSGLLLACGTACAAEARPELTLHYGKPARNWGTECLPIGNGRLGAMMDGGDVSEHIQFNEESLWIGDESETGAYQAFGDVVVALAHAPATAYRRELDIGRAVHTVTYESDGVRYQREAFASFPAKVMVFRFTADKPGSLTGTVSLVDAHKGTSTAGADKIGFSGSLEGFRYQGGSARKDGPPYAIALRYEAQVRLLHEGGSVEAVDGKLCFKNVDNMTLLLDAGTDFVQDRAKGWRGALPHEAIVARLAAAAKRPYADLLAEHVRDYQNLFQQASLSLGGGPAPDVATDERLENYRKTGVDNGLEELMFQYGR
jgi:alpha-L-fucosidase 2